MGKSLPVVRGTGISGSHPRVRRLFENLAAHPGFEVERLHPQLRSLDSSPSARLSREPPTALKARLERTIAFFEGALKGAPGTPPRARL